MLRFFLLFAAALSFAAPAQEATAPEPPALESPIAFSQQETAKLRAGKSLLKETPDSPFKDYCDNAWIAAVLVSQDAQAAAGLLLDFSNQPKIFSKLKDIAVTPLGESHYRIASTVKAGLFTFHYTTLWDYDPKKCLATFRLDDSEENDFDEYRGFWKFMPQRDEKTLILYSIRTKTKNNPFSFIEDQESRKEMTKTLEEFKAALAVPN